MAAEFKSHVLRRDEKGLLGIPFKRWLLGGVAGGLVFALASLPLGSWAIPPAVAVAAALLVFTGERRGMPLWQRLLFHWRGNLVIAAARRPEGMAARLAQALEIPVASVFVVDGDQLFAPPAAAAVVDFTEWVTLLDPQAEDDGLVFVEQAIAQDVVAAK